MRVRTYVRRIRTMWTVANFMFDLSDFEITHNLSGNINVFSFYFPECARRRRITNFFLQHHTKLCCVLKVQHQFYSFLLVSSRHVKVYIIFVRYGKVSCDAFPLLILIIDPFGSFLNEMCTLLRQSTDRYYQV